MIDYIIDQTKAILALTSVNQPDVLYGPSDWRRLFPCWLWTNGVVLFARDSSQYWKRDNINSKNAKTHDEFLSFVLGILELYTICVLLRVNKADSLSDINSSLILRERIWTPFQCNICNPYTHTHTHTHTHTPHTHTQTYTQKKKKKQLLVNQRSLPIL